MCVQMLEGLHAKKVFVGAVQPERILVEPTFCLAECCPGTLKPQSQCLYTRHSDKVARTVHVQTIVHLWHSKANNAFC